MRNVLAVAIISVIANSCPVLPVATAKAEPEPRSIAARCLKETGAVYDAERRKWVGKWRASSAQAQRYNACIDRMVSQGR